MPGRVYGCALSLVAVLAGCTQVGPDFQPLQDPWLHTWDTPLLKQAGQQASAPDLRQWWAVFADPALDALIAEADANNTNLRVAGLRIAEARAQLAIVQTGRYPQLQQLRAQSLYLKQDQSGSANARDSVFWQSSAGFDIGWEIDFWGASAAPSKVPMLPTSPPRPITPMPCCCCGRKWLTPTLPCALPRRGWISPKKTPDARRAA